MTNDLPPAIIPPMSETNPIPATEPHKANYKETIESILIALILAFVFRAFIVEAFVIPTGSMAPTLLGAHMRFTCDDCGYRFDVGYNARGQGDELNIPSFALVAERQRGGGVRLVPRVYDIRCPNCGYKVPRYKPDDADNDATAPSVHYGDRILVLKYAYLLQAPRRWDVVVFKTPDSPGYQVNYIKRLIGLPGESLMILDGDLYVRHADNQPWTVQTKPYPAQQALWRIVYDNDFHPRPLPRDGASTWTQPWKPVENPAAWNLGHSPADGRVFSFDASDAAGKIRFDPDANPASNALTDWIGYDITTLQDDQTANTGLSDTFLRPPPPLIAANVADLKLDLWYHRLAGDGPLQLRLTKLDDAFTAEILPDRVRLLHSVAAGQPVEVLAESPLPDGHGPLHLEFTNVDYHVTLRVNGAVAVQSTSEQYHPDLDRLLRAYRQDDQLPKPTIEIAAERQKSTLAHVGLFRDVYYLNRDLRGGNRHMWATPVDYPDFIMTLGPKEYFVLGDNSAVSGDARYWQKPIDLPDEDLIVGAGRVPERFMLGRAFFVYWPGGFRPGDNWPAVIPNFGSMRLIR